MTLSRQLIIVIVVLFLLVFSGTFIISVQNTRDFLEAQLDSHAQDTATSLGLSIKPHLAASDMAMMNSMVDAIFDRGYYSLIAVEKTDGATLAKRVQKITIQGVPEWFIDMVPLETPLRDSLITINWKQAAKVVVKSHPGYAYAELWSSVTETFKWTLGSLAAAIVLVLLFLRIILRPLREIRKQAVAIASREFPVLERLPWTWDLRVVVQAMNKMSKKVESMLLEQTQLAERMRREAYHDSLTGFLNKRGFKMGLENMVAAGEEVPYGALFLVQIAGFEEYNKRYGYAAGDELLKQVARLLKDLAGDTHEAVLGRMSGAQFAALIKNYSLEDAEELGKKISHGLEQVSVSEKEGIVSHAGIGYYRANLTSAELLSGADMALRDAQRTGSNAWRLYDADAQGKEELRGAQQWKEVVQNAIETKSFLFHFQPVTSLADKGVAHYEILARIKTGDGKLIPAGAFIPMAERFGITSDIDRILVEQTMSFISGLSGSEEKFALNLSSTSVYDPDFTRWLVDRLKSAPELAGRMIFEITETAAQMDIDAIASLVERLREVKTSFALDHFGTGQASFGYLMRLKLDYIKIDGSYILNISNDKENQFFVETISKIAHGLDMIVIAEMVESEADFNILGELKVDAAQGYFLGRPDERIHPD